MKQDYWRLITVLLVSLCVGLLAGQVLFCLLVGALIYVYWQHKLLHQLLLWVRRRSDNAPPDIPGVVDEIAREFDFLRMHHRQRKKKLSRYLKRFQEATEALPDAIVVMGENAEIEWSNHKAEEYIGIRCPQDNRQRIVNLIRHPDLVEYIKDSVAHDNETALELISPVNADMYLELRLAPYGKTQKLLVARDITKIHRINQMRRDFIANASHELRTPLTVISGYLEAFEDEPDGKLNEWNLQIKQMRNQTERMRRLIEDLLRLSSIETAEEVENTEPVNVPDLLVNIYDEAKTISGVFNHIFSIEAEQDLWLKGDRSQLYSAFSNLIFNAVQHTNDSGVIGIRWFVDESGAVLEISDTGEGIASEHLPRLTERFYRVDKGRSREKGGTGLGLAIVKHVLARHNAELEIESEPDKGSIFRCRFLKDSIIRKDDLKNMTLSA